MRNRKIIGPPTETQQFNAGQEVTRQFPDGPVGIVSAQAGDMVGVKWSGSHHVTQVAADQLVLAHFADDDAPEIEEEHRDSQQDDRDDSQQPQEEPDDLW
jgi:hypothetical protein